MNRTLFLLSVFVAAARPVSGQGDGGMLFSYRPHADARAQFDAGYRSHLQWHREKGDSLPWYGWDVIAGPRTGEFIDGTFGIAFAALDERVDPAGDAAHSATSFGPHAEPTGRRVIRLRRELGTATSLEDRAPTRLVQVVTYRVPPAERSVFEGALKAVRATPGIEPYAVYETIVGTSDAEYTVMVGRSGYGSFDRLERDPARAIDAASERAGESGVRSASELWLLRGDLTLLPQRTRPR